MVEIVQRWWEILLLWVVLLKWKASHPFISTKVVRVDQDSNWKWFSDESRDIQLSRLWKSKLLLTDSNSEIFRSLMGEHYFTAVGVLNKKLAENDYQLAKIYQISTWHLLNTLTHSEHVLIGFVFCWRPYLEVFV